MGELQFLNSVVKVSLPKKETFEHRRKGSKRMNNEESEFKQWKKNLLMSKIR